MQLAHDYPLASEQLKVVVLQRKIRELEAELADGSKHDLRNPAH
jgi:hypothetical protein